MVLARERGRLFFLRLKLFLTGKNGLERDCSHHGGSPLEASVVSGVLTKDIKTITGKPEHARPQPPVQWREPAALWGPKPENVPEDSFMAGSYI